MPIYEFVCESCDNEFEQIQSFSDSSVPACSKCGSAQVTRRLGRPAIHFKGSGWYINDSKKSKDKKSSNSASVTSGESSANDDATETKSESKVEANAETKSEASGDAKSGTKSESSTASKSPTTSAASD